MSKNYIFIISNFFKDILIVRQYNTTDYYKQVKYLLTQLQHIYNNLKDEHEVIIIEKYSCYAKWYTVRLTSKINFLILHHYSFFHTHNTNKNNLYIFYAKIYMIILFYFFVVLSVCSIFGFIIAQLWPNIIGVVLSRNISQSRHLLITTEYFIDQEKHFYLIVLHTYAAVCIGCTAMIAIGTMILAYLQHTCGMLSISRYKTNTEKIKILIVNKII